MPDADDRLVLTADPRFRLRLPAPGPSRSCMDPSVSNIRLCQKCRTAFGAILRPKIDSGRAAQQRSGRLVQRQTI